MDLTPSQVAATQFRTVRKGYDPDEVDSFLQRASKALETAQQQATSMEARARAAVARLQEVSAEQSKQPVAEPGGGDVVRVSVDEAETISRALVLAQRTADATVADARLEAERILSEARAEHESTLDSTREMSAKLLEDARTEARKLTEAERKAAENEVQSLVARREFLVGDVDQLEQFLIDQRERLRTAARQLEAMCDRVPAGLGHVNPPLLSASDDPPGDDTAEHFRPPLDDTLDDDEPGDDEPGDDGDWSADPAPEDESSPGTSASAEMPVLPTLPAHPTAMTSGQPPSALASALEATARHDVQPGPRHS
jgi:DivIVA domain-containing protein